MSRFEAHTGIIHSCKESEPVGYGHKIWPNEVEGGLMWYYRILDSIPINGSQV